jgi:hypothetical protein
MCVCVCMCARVVIGNVKFSTSNTKSPKTGYYLQAAILTHLPLIANHTEQTDCIITHIGTLGPIFRGQESNTVQILGAAEGTNCLSRNVGKKLPLVAA